MAKIAFIGLGVMGFPMAGHLHKAGHEVVVYNRTTAKAENWASAHQGGTWAATPSEAVQGVDFVCLCVGRDADVEQVMCGEQGVLAGLAGRSGVVIVDHTTTSAQLARQMHECAQAQGASFIDAPVSGGQKGAETGTLSIMMGGEAALVAKAMPLLQAYGKTLVHIGPSGCGQLAKMVNQICIAGVVQGLSEGLAFGQKAGLEMDKVVSVISKGAAGSWQMDNRATTMLADQFDFGFAVDWMRKDLGLCLEEAHRIGAQLPLAQLVDGFYAELQQQGCGRMDTSSLVKRLR
jgi:3-hydroxyisobutyrate dehydrogenase